MPSPAHEVPLQLLHEQPSLLATLLEKLGHGHPIGELVPVDANIRFADPVEVRPDLVFRAERPPWLLLELQTRVDPDKARRWLLAAALRFNETGTMGEVVILTSSDRVASWANDVAHAHGEFGTRLALTPLVLHIAGDTVDAMLDEAHPELAFFAAWAMHTRDDTEAERVVFRATELTGRLPEALRAPARRAIFAVLTEPMILKLREASMNPHQFPESAAARSFREFFEGMGKREGLVEGKREGLVEGKREALLNVLATRGLTPSDEERGAIEACTDVRLLDAWVARAVTATVVAEVLAARAG